MTMRIISGERSAGTGKGGHLVASFLSALLALACFSSVASAETIIGSEGSGAGQILRPGAIAVDSSNGTVYVGDEENKRVDIFNSNGSFIRAFGWGVADGESPELQVCTAVCFKGLAGGGAGQFSPDRNSMRSIAIDDDPSSPSFHDVYVADSLRVQKFSPTGQFLLAWGGGAITGGAAGTGNLTVGSSTVTHVVTAKKRFALGQEITGSAIAAGTKIVGLGEDEDGNGTLTLSQPAAATQTEATLTVAEGAGNIPQNERQIVSETDTEPGSPPAVGFSSPPPGGQLATAPFPVDPYPTAAEFQTILQGLSTIGPGNVSVTGPIGGPYTVEFKGARYSDTDVASIVMPGRGRSNIEVIATGGGAAEICTAANASSCSGGLPGDGPGRYGSSPEIAVGPSGIVYTLSNKDNSAATVQKFNPDGTPIAQYTVPFAESIAVDSSGNFYLVRPGIAGISKYDQNGTLLATFASGTVTGPLTIDASDHLFNVQTEFILGRNYRAVAEYDASGNLLRRFDYVEKSTVDIAAYHSASGDILRLDEGASPARYVAFPPQGPIVLPGALRSEEVRSARVTMAGGASPYGEPTTYHFDYVNDAEFQVNGFSGAGVKHSPDEPLGEDFSLHLARYETHDVVPSTLYHFRLVVSNAHGAAISDAGMFETLPPISIEATWATEVDFETAILHTELNPLGSPATGYFEYVDDAAFQENEFAQAAKVPAVDQGASPLDFGSGENPVARAATGFGLEPGTKYHYRFHAANPFVTVVSSVRTVTTLKRQQAPSSDQCPNAELRFGNSAGLPNCRAYEMVTPVEKNNGDVFALAEFTTAAPSQLDLSAADGESFTYSANRAFGDAVSAPYSSQYIARRGPNGWLDHSISPPETLYTREVAPSLRSEFRAFSADLCSGWLATVAEPLLAPDAVPDQPNIYRRDNCGEKGYETLTTAAPTGEFKELELEPQGFSDDYLVSIYEANDNLTAEVPANSLPAPRLYASGSGKLRYVCHLPDGKALKTPCSAGSANFFAPGPNLFPNVTNAISASGNRVYWTSYANNSEKQAGQIYLRINPTREQSQVAVGKCTEAAKACTLAVSGTVTPARSRYWTAAADGSKAIFSVEDGELEGNLYEYTASKGTSKLIAEGTVGVVGASENASRIYFASTKALAAGAQEGDRNLYLYEAAGSFAFIGVLGSQEPALNALSSEMYRHAARITPDGSHVAFVSTGSPTGYDNRDAKTGNPDSEVFLYNAAGHSLFCVSCNPSGARPVGANLELRGRTGFGAARIPGWQTNLSPSHPLTEDGSHLFFESADALVPEDTNGQKDVYQWEEPGTGACSAQSSDYSEPNGGCLTLISSGRSPYESVLLDASPDGRDVFFATLSSFVPQDYGLVDIYDARINGGYPPPPALPAACEGEACQGPLSTPNDPTPASSSYRGPGNLKPEASEKKRSKHRHKRRKPHHRTKHRQHGKSTHKHTSRGRTSR
jgi:hypothetical protein